MLIKISSLVLILLSCDVKKCESFEQKIVGGEEADPGEFKFAVGVYQDEKYICGGSVIHEKYVLTAAGCYHGRDVIYQIGYGNNNRQEHEMSEIVKFQVHELYDKNTLENDVALIETVKIFSDLVKLVEKESEIGSPVIAIGWGTGDNQELQYQLQKVSSKIISHDECKMFHNGALFDSQICTRANTGQGICSGDAGSALLGLDGELVGVISAAYYTCASGVPDFHSSVHFYKKWILETINNENV